MRRERSSLQVAHVDLLPLMSPCRIGAGSTVQKAAWTQDLKRAHATVRPQLPATRAGSQWTGIEEALSGPSAWHELEPSRCGSCCSSLVAPSPARRRETSRSIVSPADRCVSASAFSPRDSASGRDQTEEAHLQLVRLAVSSAATSSMRANGSRACQSSHCGRRSPSGSDLSMPRPQAASPLWLPSVQADVAGTVALSMATVFVAHAPGRLLSG